jgi:tryptophan synthase alpha chain
MAWARSQFQFSFIPIMMGYTNTLIQYGEDAFCQKIASCGGRGLIIPDHPPEEDTQLLPAAKRHGLSTIMLMTPTTTDERLHTLGRSADGFVYCVARRGVTGAKTALDASVAQWIERCKRATSLPLAVGFGISSPDDVAFLKGHAEIAVVGTAFLTAWETSGPNAAKQLLAALTQTT